MNMSRSMECRGTTRPASETVKEDGWQRLGILVINILDDCLTWPEKELVNNLGKKLYGKRKGRKSQ